MNDTASALDKLADAASSFRVFLKQLFSKNVPAYERAGLVSLPRAAHVLATRLIPDPEYDVSEQFRRELELQWYFQYIESLQSVSVAVQSAIKNGGLVPRNSLTRARYVGSDLERWLDKSIPAAVQKTNSELLAGAIPIDSIKISWLNLVAPPLSVGVIPQELAHWCETAGIADAGEVNALLVEPAPAPAEEQASDNRGRPTTKKQTEIDVVLASLERKGFNPLALPVGNGKQGGAKQSVWHDVGKKFTSRNAFDSRWKQMKADRVIADAK